MRIDVAVERPPPVRIIVDGRPITAYPGEMVAAALLAAGIRFLRSSPRAETPRGSVCLMGICQECVLDIDGRSTEACRIQVRDGMIIKLGRAH